MSGEGVTGSLTIIDGTELLLEIVQLETGEQGVLLTATSEEGSEVEVFLPVQEAREIGLDLMILSRNAQTHNEGGAA